MTDRCSTCPHNLSCDHFQIPGGCDHEYWNVPKDYAKMFREAALKAEMEVVNLAMTETKGNHTKAAKLLDIDRKTLYNRIAAYEMMTGKRFYRFEKP